VPEEREEVRHYPFLWLRLRGIYGRVDYSNDQRYQELPSPLAEFINSVVGVKGVSPLLLERREHPTKTFRSQTGRRLRRVSTFVTISHTGAYQRQSGTSCFEDRRQSAF
jgi:hypothetical protein